MIKLFLYLAIILSIPLKSYALSQAQATKLFGEGVPYEEIILNEKDCINTFSLKVIIKASNIGAAYGTFSSGEFLLAKRFGAGKNDCIVSLITIQPNKTKKQEQFQCLFEHKFQEQ